MLPWCLGVSARPFLIAAAAGLAAALTSCSSVAYVFAVGLFGYGGNWVVSLPGRPLVPHDFQIRTGGEGHLTEFEIYSETRDRVVWRLERSEEGSRRKTPVSYIDCGTVPTGMKQVYPADGAPEQIAEGEPVIVIVNGRSSVGMKFSRGYVLGGVSRYFKKDDCYQPVEESQ